MQPREALLAAIHAAPDDDVARQALADWLEEQGDPASLAQAELARLHLRLRRSLDCAERRADEARLRELLLAGTRPCVPTLTNSLGMTFALVPPGTFLMGSHPDEIDRYPDESPLHEVQISRAFYVSVVPVTQEQYRRLTGTSPSHFSATGENHEAVAGLDTRAFPVEGVSWHEAVAFCEKLSESPEEKEARRVYRLPTEAEWEYACRGATTTTVPFLFGISLSSRQANFDGDHPYGDAGPGPHLGRPMPVGSGPANALGLFDLHGNVWDWCADRYGEPYYRKSPAADPTGPKRGRERVVRGGSWNAWGKGCRAAHRGMEGPDERDDTTGFRPVLTLAGRAEAGAPTIARARPRRKGPAR
jgi:uncharacterized protein (TIGR02996 family)